MRISLCSSLWKIWKSWKSKKLFSSSSLKIGENSWIEGEMFNIIYCKLWKICELWYDGSRRNFIEAFLTKLVKSKDARSRSVHKISIVTHAIVASIVVGDLIKLHCLAELAFLNLHCRVVDTQLAKAFVSDRSNNATVFAFLYFYKRVAFLAHFLRSGSKEKGRRTIRFRSRFFN